jgi:hypothetical protein
LLEKSTAKYPPPNGAKYPPPIPFPGVLLQLNLYRDNETGQRRWFLSLLSMVSKESNQRKQEETNNERTCPEYLASTQ